MKHFTKCLKFLLLALCVVGGVGSAWADSYTITFSTGNGDGTAASTSTACSDIVSEGSSYLSGDLVTATKVYGAGSNGLKLGASSSAGTIKMNLVSSVTPTSIVVNAKLYNSGKAATLSVNGKTAQSLTSSFADYTFDFNSEISYIQLDGSKYCWINSITVNYAAAPSYTITPQTNNENYGTVELLGSTITATPKDGYRVMAGDAGYTVTSGTATVTNNGDNTFSVSPSTDCTVQINFEEIPKYTVTLGDNSSTLTEESAGAGVTLPSRSAIGDYTFAGWSDSNVTEETTTAPTIIPAGEYAPTSNVTLYPVYTRTEGGGESETDVSSSMSDIATSNSWSTSSGNNVTCYTSFALDSNITISTTGDANCGSFWGSDWRLYQNKDGNVIVTAKEGCTLNKVTFTFSVSNTGALYYDEAAVTSETAVNVSGTSEEFTVGNSGSATNGQVRITDISVTYSAASNTTYYLSAPVATAISTPTFTLAAGTYTGTQSVEIECATDGVTIYYTTNGDEPTTSSVVYSEAIEVSANTTIKAIAVKDEEQSNVGSAIYNIKVAAPTFSVEAGTYDENQTVLLESVTAGATIYYTTDGSIPTTSSSVYSEAIEVTSTTTIKAIAVKDGLTDSDVSAATYTLKVSAPTFSIEEGKYPTEQSVELSCATVGATIYYTIDNSTPSVNSASSSVYSSAITVNSTTTIKAIAVKSGYTESDISSAKYTIVLDNTPGTNYFEKVTDASTLAAGDNILFVYETVEKAMSATQKTNNRDGVDVTITSSSISGVSNSVQRILLQGSAGAWYFYVDGSTSGYLYAASSSNNYMKTEENKDDNAKATITISSGDATITFQGSNKNKLLKYNSGSSLFSCYASGQDPVQIYKEMPKLPVTIGSALYTTYCPTKAVTFDASVTAYVASAVNGEWITLTEVSSVPAGTPVIVGAATSGTYILNLTESASDPASNLLKVSDGTITGGPDIYALAQKDDIVGFYLVDESVTIPAGKCYLQTSGEAKARLLFNFGEDVSGIQTVDGATSKVNDGAIYNLSGQRVNASYKGIVIKNGKKYLNK